MSARIVWIDCETTGTDPYRDRVVEVALIDTGRSITHLIDPGIPIPEEATAVHGITDEDVRGCPTFAEIAHDLQERLSGEDVVLGGYNSASFDVCILDAELRRAGQPGLHLSIKRDVDVMRIWNALEPRSLEGAVRRYLGVDHEDAHGSEADAVAVAEVFGAMGLSVEDAMALTFDESAVDRDGRFRIEDGVVVFAFGKHEGKRIVTEPDYLRWMLSADFSPEVKAICRRALERTEAA